MCRSLAAYVLLLVRFVSCFDPSGTGLYFHKNPVGIQLGKNGESEIWLDDIRQLFASLNWIRHLWPYSASSKIPDPLTTWELQNPGNIKFAQNPGNIKFTDPLLSRLSDCERVGRVGHWTVRWSILCFKIYRQNVLCRVDGVKFRYIPSPCFNREVRWKLAHD